MSILRWIPAAALLSVLLPQAPAADAPRKASEYVFNLPGGKTLLLSQYQGHPIVMAAILTTCSDCQMTVGVLSKLQNEYRPRGLQVLAAAVAAGDDIALPMFLKNFAPSFPVGYSTAQIAAPFFRPTGASPMMPLLLFIDRQGNIRSQHEGEEPFFDNLEANLRKEIDALLKVGAPARTSAAAPKK